MSDFLFIYGCRERLSALFQCLQTKKNLSLLYSDFIPFFEKAISDFIPFWLTNTKKPSIISVIKPDFGETLC